MANVSKKGENQLVSNVIWLILTLLFLSLLVLFVESKSDNTSKLQEKYAKQIALILDNAKPGMKITIDMYYAFRIMKDRGMSPDEIHSQLVTIKDNTVNVKINEDGNGFSYSFFNDINIQLVKGHPIPDIRQGRYIFTVLNYNEK